MRRSLARLLGAGAAMASLGACATITAPGMTPLDHAGAAYSHLQAAADRALPLLPGAATASEAMQALEMGFDMLKFFPAGPAGGPSYLKALGGPLPGIGFCPTGGVSVENARDYLALPNVLCVGGSWVAPEAMMRAGDWAGIETLAREAASLTS